MKSALAAFRFALVGFALPFSFVFKPELLMLTKDNEPASILMIAAVVGITLVAIVGLATSIAGFAFRKIGLLVRVVLLLLSLSIFFLRLEGVGLVVQLVAAGLIAAFLIFDFLIQNSKAATVSEQTN